MSNAITNASTALEHLGSIPLKHCLSKTWGLSSSLAKNFLTITFLSSSLPMMLMGDEVRCAQSATTTTVTMTSRIPSSGTYSRRIAMFSALSNCFSPARYLETKKVDRYSSGVLVIHRRRGDGASAVRECLSCGGTISYCAL